MSTKAMVWCLVLCVIALAQLPTGGFALLCTVYTSDAGVACESLNSADFDDLVDPVCINFLEENPLTKKLEWVIGAASRRDFATADQKAGLQRFSLCETDNCNKCELPKIFVTGSAETVSISAVVASIVSMTLIASSF